MFNIGELVKYIEEEKSAGNLKKYHECFGPNVTMGYANACEKILTKIEELREEKKEIKKEKQTFYRLWVEENGIRRIETLEEKPESGYKVLFALKAYSLGEARRMHISGVEAEWLSGKEPSLYASVYFSGEDVT